MEARGQDILTARRGNIIKIALEAKRRCVKQSPVFEGALSVLLTYKIGVRRTFGFCRHCGRGGRVGGEIAAISRSTYLEGYYPWVF